MKRTFSLMLVIALLAALCAIPAMAEDVTLNAIFMKQAGYSEDDVLAMTQAFTESTGIQVNPTFVAYEELAPKILTSAASGGYDVILGDCIWPAQFAKAGLVLDVTDRVSALDLDDIYQGALDATKYEGKYYGMPWLNDVKYMFVNMELLKQVGVEEAPTTWDQLIEDAQLCKEQGVRCAASDHWRYGGEGAIELAQAVVEACEEPVDLKFLYPLEMPLRQRVELIAKEVYGADGVDWSPLATEKAERFESDPHYADFCTMMVKTHLSLSDKPEVKGVPKGWRLPIRDILVYGGAKFLCPMAGTISMMPGTGSHPAYRRVDVDTQTGKVSGLF